MSSVVLVRAAGRCISVRSGAVQDKETRRVGWGGGGGRATEGWLPLKMGQMLAQQVMAPVRLNCPRASSM